MTARRGGARKRSITIAGHRTSIALEAPFWRVIEALARAEGLSLAAFAERVDAARADADADAPPGLASALRLAALDAALRGAVTARDIEGDDGVAPMRRCVGARGGQ